MRRWETFIALLAVIVASVGALPVHSRLFFAFTAMLLLGVVAVSRLRSAMAGRSQSKPIFDAAERARTIREQRSKRH